MVLQGVDHAQRALTASLSLADATTTVLNDVRASTVAGLLTKIPE
jgi:hypothetical protein